MKYFLLLFSLLSITILISCEKKEELPTYFTAFKGESFTTEDTLRFYHFSSYEGEWGSQPEQYIEYEKLGVLSGDSQSEIICGSQSGLTLPVNTQITVFRELDQTMMGLFEEGSTCVISIQSEDFYPSYDDVADTIEFIKIDPPSAQSEFHLDVQGMDSVTGYQLGFDTPMLGYWRTTSSGFGYNAYVSSDSVLVMNVDWDSANNLPEDKYYRKSYSRKDQIYIPRRQPEYSPVQYLGFSMYCEDCPDWEKPWKMPKGVSVTLTIDNQKLYFSEEENYFRKYYYWIE